MLFPTFYSVSYGLGSSLANQPTRTRYVDSSFSVREKVHDCGNGSPDFNYGRSVGYANADGHFSAYQYSRCNGVMGLQWFIDEGDGNHDYQFLRNIHYK